MAMMHKTNVLPLHSQSQCRLLPLLSEMVVTWQRTEFWICSNLFETLMGRFSLASHAALVWALLASQQAQSYFQRSHVCEDFVHQRPTTTWFVDCEFYNPFHWMEKLVWSNMTTMVAPDLTMNHSDWTLSMRMQLQVSEYRVFIRQMIWYVSIHRYEPQRLLVDRIKSWFKVHLWNPEWPVEFVLGIG